MKKWDGYIPPNAHSEWPEADENESLPIWATLIMLIIFVAGSALACLILANLSLITGV